MIVSIYTRLRLRYILFVGLYVGAIARQTYANERPNILWITIEDTSPYFVGCYGNEVVSTPNIDRLAGEGIRFTNAFSTNTVSSPSRTSIITGVPTWKTGTGNHRSKYPVPNFMKGFPYYLQQLGYYTTNTSKTDYNVANEEAFIREAWCESSPRAGWWNRSAGQPFFAVFNFDDSHQSRTMTWPYDRYRQEVLDKLDPAERVPDNSFEVPPIYRDSPEMRKQLARVYNSLNLTDKKIGRLLERLQEDGLADNTIIFFFADHGEGIPRGKTNGIDLGYRVPFVIWFPPMYHHLSPWGNRVVTDELVSFEDLAPTLISMCGGEVPEHMEGRVLMGENRDKPAEYLMLASDRSDNGPDMVRTITDGRYVYSRNYMAYMPELRYINYMEIGEIKQHMRDDLHAGKLNKELQRFFEPRPAEFLFDTESDPWEMHNLADDVQHSIRLQKMSAELQRRIIEGRDVMLLPEFEIAKLAASGQSPFLFRMDEKKFPLKSIYEAASLSGKRNNEVIRQQLEMLTDSNKIVRYWAALGLMCQPEQALLPHREVLLQALQDTYPPVAITAAAINWNCFSDQSAGATLIRYAKSDNGQLALMSLNYMLYVKGQEIFVQTLKDLNQQDIQDANVRWAVEDFLESAIFTSGYATGLNTAIEKSGFYEIKAVLDKETSDKNFTLTAGDRKTYTGFLTGEGGYSVIPLGFLSAGAVVDIKMSAPATLSVVRKETETVKSGKTGVKIGKTVLHEVKHAGFYGLANAALSCKRTSGEELDLRVFVRNQSPLFRQRIQPGATVSMDMEIGWLEPGDIIDLEIVSEGIEVNATLAYDILFLAQADIQGQIDRALSRNEPVTYIYPGRYYVNPDRRAAIYLKGLSDFTVHAYDVEMVLRKPSQRILEIQGCTDVAIKGFVADNDPLLFPQGTIVSVAENGAWMDIELHGGYPVPTAKNGDRSMVHDPDTYHRKKNARDFVVVKVEKRGTATYRLFTGQNKPGHGWEPGDYVSLANPGTSYSCFINESTHFQLVDVTLHSCAKHWSIFEKFSSECLYRNVTMKPGPRPLLASVERLRSTHSDGIHSKYAGIGPRIEDCYFEGLGDDAVAIHGGFGVVLGDAEGDVVELGVQDDFFRPGDRIRFYTDSGDMIYRKVVSTSPIEKDADQIQKLIKKHYPNLKFVRLYQQAYSVRLDSSMAVSEGELVANLDRNGKGFSVRNNEVKIGRARGLLIKASDGIVEGNRISHLALPGIVLAAEANDFMEADVVSNVVVRNNTIESVNEGLLDPNRQIQAGGLVVVFFGKKITGHRNIRIEDNRFINIPGVNIQISHATDVRVNRNVFIGSHHRESIAGQNAGVDNSALIWMDYVNGVTFGEGKNGNLYQGIGKYADKANLIRYTENARNVKGEIYPQ